MRLVLLRVSIIVMAAAITAWIMGTMSFIPAHF
jgi:hypothetical protein